MKRYFVLAVSSALLGAVPCQADDVRDRVVHAFNALAQTKAEPAASLGFVRGNPPREAMSCKWS